MEKGTDYVEIFWVM